MSGLSNFLRDNKKCKNSAKFVASKSFLDDEGNPIQWEIKALSASQEEAIRASCTKKVPTPGKKGVFVPETDYNLYVGKMAAMCTVFPNLNDAELQNSYGVMGADMLLKEMLLPGEYTAYISKVQEVNGFDVSMDEIVEEAKN